MKLVGCARAKKVALSLLTAGLCPSQQQEAMTWSVFVAHPARAFLSGFSKASLGHTEEWARLVSCACSLLFSHLVLPPRSSAPGVLERSHTLVPADTTKVRQEGCETCPGGWTGLCQPSLCLVFPSLFAVLWFKIVEMMLCSRFFELINVHDLLMFWEPTTWCSSFKRLEYFVLKKRREKHFPLKLRLQN